jgi:hypothetical protein
MIILGIIRKCVVTIEELDLHVSLCIDCVIRNEKNECMKMRGYKSFDALGAVVKRGRDDLYEQLVMGGSMLACTYL